MKQKYLLLALALLGLTAETRADLAAVVDSNNAFYSGETRDYLLTAPPAFELNQKAAQADGYSCAFVPIGVAYEEAETLIGVHYFKIRGMSFTEAFAKDTSNLRRFFGKDFALQPVAINGNKHAVELKIFAPVQNGKPTEMRRLAYVNGETEILILDLTVKNEKKASAAVEAFENLLSLFKTTVRKQLGNK